MAVTNHKAGGTDQTGELDRMLDAALSNYSVVEPRAGLEERVLANLRAQQSQPARHSWWQWSLAAGLTAVVVVTIALLARVRTPVAPVISHKPPLTNTAPVNSTQEVARQSAGTIERAKPHHKIQGHHDAPVVATAPKLDHFPSPQPLTSEEIALARYVRNFPKEAQLVAKAQEEFELETQKELNAGSEIRTSNSIEQER